jgi:hypothetical protein
MTVSGGCKLRAIEGGREAGGSEPLQGLANDWILGCRLCRWVSWGIGVGARLHHGIVPTSYSGGPRAGAIPGGRESSPKDLRIFLASTPSMMKEMIRI